MWTSKDALEDWHMATYYKHAKEWAAGGGTMPEVWFSFYGNPETAGSTAVFKNVEVQGFCSENSETALLLLITTTLLPAKCNV